MSKFTYTYRGEYIHADRQTIDGEDVELFHVEGMSFDNQKDAHQHITRMLIDLGKVPLPSIIPDIKQEIHLCLDGDPRGECSAWMFALAEWMRDNYCTIPPYDFRSGIGGTDTETYTWQFLEMMQPTEGECEYLAALLNRWDRKNRTLGKDY